MVSSLGKEETLHFELNVKYVYMYDDFCASLRR